jgi:hypothetical protein
MFGHQGNIKRSGCQLRFTQIRPFGSGFLDRDNALGALIASQLKR